MINWKKAAKGYREAATTAMVQLLQVEELSRQEAEVITAAKTLVRLITTPTNPYVRLLAGQDINIQNAQEILVNKVSELEKVIQTYSQDNGEIPSSK